MCVLQRFFFNFRFLCGCILHLWALTIWVCMSTNFWSASVAGMCPFWYLFLACIRGTTSSQTPSALSRGNLMLLKQLSPRLMCNVVEYTDLGAWWSHLTPLPYKHDGEGSSFTGLMHDAIPFSVSLVALNWGLLLASSHKLWRQARLLPISLAGRMSVFKLIC